MIRLALNILWLICGGFVTAFGYLVGGLVLCLTVVGIPFGVQCFKLAGLAFWPFGQTAEEIPSRASGGVIELLMNVLWFLVAGVWIALAHLGHAVALAVTIIGLPFAFQHVKLALFSVFPFGRRIVDAPR
jgi:uncharacterized membrane protein YccF (DUF307 family)